MSSNKSLRLQKNDLVLVTGANGYIGSHVVDVLLEEGFRVRGTVRSDKPWLNNLFEKRHSPNRFETFELQSIKDESALANAFQDVTGVIHVASAVALNPNPDEVIPAVIANTLAMMRVAASQSTVRSVVLTSSSTAAAIPEPNKRVVVDEHTWNDAAVKAVRSQNLPAQVMSAIVYAASKTEGERAAWKWYQENKPRYTFSTVLPDMNLGAILAPEIPGSTMGWTRSLLDGDNFVMKNFPPHWYVDVKDTARLHVAALLDPAIHDERIFAYAAPFNFHDVVGILRHLRPQNTRIPDPPENESRSLSEVTPSKRAEQILRDFFGVKGWVSLEDSLSAGIAGHP